jgi:DNA-binding beta-propeller fold protein YncE
MIQLTIRGVMILVLALVLAPASVFAEATSFELWVVDQADADKGGSKIYIYPGEGLGKTQFAGQPEVVDLTQASQGIGAGSGVRPHLLLFNQNHSHAILASVTSGHVHVIRAADRQVVASIDVGEQAHGAVPAPDGSFILVANQNGKKLARIKSNFATEQFSHDPADDLDLKALEGPGQPDNAPICPLLFTPDGKKTYVTLRGGGLYVVDTASTPMTVVKSFTKEEVAPAGCGGVAIGNTIYINSGTARTGHLYVFDAATDSLVKTFDTTNSGTDAHGMALVGGGKHLWMANRGQGHNIVVVDAATNSIVGTFGGFGAAPDLLESSPVGDQVFMTLRGPNNLTGGPSAKGQTPGVAVLSVQNDGRNGALAYFIPIGDQSANSPVDPHALAVRQVAAPVPSAPAPAAPAPSPVAPTALPRTGGLPLDLFTLLAPALGLFALGTGIVIHRAQRRRS